MFSLFKKERISGYPDSLLRIEESLGLVSNVKTSKEDLVFLYSIIFSKKPSNVLEIGRFNGASTLILAGALADNHNNGTLYSIDTDDMLSNDVKTVLKYNTVLVTDSSVNLDNNPLFENIKFQAFFIDGDHSSEMVYNDIIKCLSMSDVESVILCHDTSMPTVRNGIDIALSNVSELIDCGTFGSDIQMLIYKK